MKVWALCRAAIAAIAMIAAPALAAGTVWRIATPQAGFADLPTLAPAIDEALSDGFGNLMFACDNDRVFLLVVLPSFPFGATTEGALVIGADGPRLPLELRDLYGAPVADAPRIDRDATMLWAEIAPEDLAEMAPVDLLALAVGPTDYAVPLDGFAAAVPEFLHYCATGAKGDATLYAE